MDQPFTNTKEPLAQRENCRGLNNASVVAGKDGLIGSPEGSGAFQGPWFEKTIAENSAWRNQADGYLG